MIKYITTGNRQTIYDIALQEYGSADGVFLLMKDNPTAVPDLNTNLQPGTKLAIKSSPIDQGIVDFYSRLNVKPATYTQLPSSDEVEVLGTEDEQIITTEQGAQLQKN